MGGAPLLLAFAVVTVDYGWESDGRDGYRYIVQIPAEQFEDIERTGKITSQLPPELRGRVTSVEVRVGDGEVPRPSVPPLTRAAGPDPSHITASGSEQSLLLPSPEETVRGQGESSGFAYPPDEDDAEADTESAGSDAAAAPPANSFGPSNFNGFGPQKPATSTKHQDAPSTSRSNSTPSTSRAEPNPSSSSGPSAANSLESGSATADSSRDYRWSRDPAPSRGSPSRSTDPANSTEDPPSLRPNPSPEPTDEPSPAGNTASAENHSSTGNTASTGNSSSVGSPDRPPASNARAGAASDFELGAEARQRLADQQLLAEVGIDDDAYAYDKHTGLHLTEDDPRYPLIVDYVRRMERAAAASDSRAARLSAPQPTGGNEQFGSSYAPRSHTKRAERDGSPWDSPQQYQPVANHQRTGGDRRFAQIPAGAATMSNRDSAAADEARGESRSGVTSGGEEESPSDAGVGDHRSDSRHRSLAAQPLFNFLLLLSLVGNVYLGIAISRLIRRYRDLVSSHRGTAIPGQ